jgi:hypothetical protein
MMIFNYSIAESIGKLLFVIFDTIAVYFLWKIIAKNKSSKENNKNIQHANFVAKLYGFNPLFIYLTVRGSC